MDSRPEAQTYPATMHHQQQEMRRHYLTGKEWAQTQNGMRCFQDQRRHHPQQPTKIHDPSEYDHFGSRQLLPKQNAKGMNSHIYRLRIGAGIA